ncbi:hypothetical protein D3C72_2207490 [compost metagenome]
MERESRHKADDALGYPLGGLGQAMIDVERRVGELIKAPCEPKHLPIPLHAAHCGGRYASLAQLYKTRDPTHLKKGVGDLALGGGFGH